MINNINLQDIPSILSYGFIGLGFLLALLTFMLLVKAINSASPRNSNVFLISIFMIFSLLMAGGGAYIELVSKSKLEDLQVLKVKINSLVEDNTDLSKELESTKKQLRELNEEIALIKGKTFNWTYKASGKLFQCYVDGEKVGVRLNCEEHSSCGNYQLNRGICALLYSHQVFN